jgi:hypothetical protein
MSHERLHSPEIIRAYCRSRRCERGARALGGARATIDPTLVGR